MKKLWLFIICLNLSNNLSFGEPKTQGSLTYDETHSQLFLDGWPLPSWVDGVLEVTNNTSYYRFVHPSLYPETGVKGWKISDQTPEWDSFFKNGGSCTPSTNDLESGWFYSTQKPSSLPDGWVYMPSFSLFANKMGLKALSQFFHTYMGSIPILDSSIVNSVKIGNFTRLIIPPIKDLAYFDISLPSSMVMAYKATIPQGEGTTALILYTLSDANSGENNKNNFIKGNIVKKDGSQTPFFYKIVFSKD